MKIFITGVAGFLGSHLADALIEEGHEVSGCDNFLGGDFDNVHPDCDFTEADCRNFDAMSLLMEGIDVVYHCAATAHEGLSVFSPSFITDNIYAASVSTFSAAISNSVKRIIYCSSMARYGDGNHIMTSYSNYSSEYYLREGVPLGQPFEEYYLPNPQDPYGIAKVAAEETLKSLCEVHGVEYVIAVPHNIIGPRQKYDDPYRNVASIMANKILKGEQPIIYGDGRQKRCFSYIDDCIPSLVKMKDADVSGEIINIGPDEEPIEINDLAFMISDIVGVDYDPCFVDARPAEVKEATCSSDKARRLLGYETKTGLREGLEALVGYIRENGVKSFKYDYPLEIINKKTPKTWKNQLI